MSDDPPPPLRPLQPQRPHHLGERMLDIRRHLRRRLHEAKPKRLREPRPFIARDGTVVRPVALVSDEHADRFGPVVDDGLAEGGKVLEGGARGDVVDQEAGLAFATGRSVALQVCKRCVVYRAHSSHRDAYSPVEQTVG